MWNIGRHIPALREQGEQAYEQRAGESERWLREREHKLLTDFDLPDLCDPLADLDRGQAILAKHGVAQVAMRVMSAGIWSPRTGIWSWTWSPHVGSWTHPRQPEPLSSGEADLRSRGRKQLWPPFVDTPYITDERGAERVAAVAARERYAGAVLRVPEADDWRYLLAYWPRPLDPDGSTRLELVTCVHLQPLERELAELGVPQTSKRAATLADGISPAGSTTFECMFFGIPGRARLPDVVEYVELDNRGRPGDRWVECTRCRSSVVATADYGGPLSPLYTHH